MAKSQYKDAKKKREAGAFVALPHAVIRSPQWVSLSAHGAKLLVDLMAQYRGNNNGDLCATWSMMEDRGWRSRDTLAKALRELLDRKWIVQTRQGGLHAPSLYALTFFALDEMPKLELSARTFPRGAWRHTDDSMSAGKERIAQHAGRVKSSGTGTPAVSPPTVIAGN